MAKYHGKSSAITWGGVTIPGTEWAWESDVGEVEITSTTSASDPAADGSVWDEWLVGFGNATVTVSALYDDAVTLPIHGASATFVGTYGGGHSITCTVFFRGGPRGSRIKDAARVTLRGRMTGKPTFS